MVLQALCDISKTSDLNPWLAAHRRHDSGVDHQREGGGDHQGDPGLPELQEAAHQHAGPGEGERSHQRPVL